MLVRFNTTKQPTLARNSIDNELLSSISFRQNYKQIYSFKRPGYHTKYLDGINVKKTKTNSNRLTDNRPLLSLSLPQPEG